MYGQPYTSLSLPLDRMASKDFFYICFIVASDLGVVPDRCRYLHQIKKLRLRET